MGLLFDRDHQVVGQRAEGGFGGGWCRIAGPVGECHDGAGQGLADDLVFH